MEYTFLFEKFLLLQRRYSRGRLLCFSGYMTMEATPLRLAVMRPARTTGRHERETNGTQHRTLALELTDTLRDCTIPIIRVRT
jgi:hypothetical protein